MHFGRSPNGVGKVCGTKLSVGCRKRQAGRVRPPITESFPLRTDILRAARFDIFLTPARLVLITRPPPAAA
jgi:hypothetical protein